MATGFIYVEKLTEREHDSIIQSGTFPTYRVFVTVTNESRMRKQVTVRTTAKYDEAMTSAEGWSKMAFVRAVRIVEAAA